MSKTFKVVVNSISKVLATQISKALMRSNGILFIQNMTRRDKISGIIVINFHENYFILRQFCQPPYLRDCQLSCSNLLSYLVDHFIFFIRRYLKLIKFKKSIKYRSQKRNKKN